MAVACHRRPEAAGSVLTQCADSVCWLSVLTNIIAVCYASSIRGCLSAKSVIILFQFVPLSAINFSLNIILSQLNLSFGELQEFYLKQFLHHSQLFPHSLESKIFQMKVFLEFEWNIRNHIFIAIDLDKSFFVAVNPLVPKTFSRQFWDIA